MQRSFDFDLDPKIGAIQHMPAPALVKKLLTAIAVFGCAHPTDVVLGSGGEDGEWLLSPTRHDLCALAGVNVATLKRWLGSADVAESAFLWVRRGRSERHEYVVYWTRVFAAAEAIRSTADTQCAPPRIAECAPAHSANAPGRISQMRPGAFCNLRGGAFRETGLGPAGEEMPLPDDNAGGGFKYKDKEENHQPTNQTKQAEEPKTNERAWGWPREIAPAEIGRWQTLLALHRHCVRVGVLTDDDLVTFFALAFSVAKTKAELRRNPPGLLKWLVDHREAWESRLTPEAIAEGERGVAWLRAQGHLAAATVDAATA